ncbi:MAG: hypothetical protein HQM12_10025 [SAR324 cluster bacterium]|nr:hypothetical protein [SAR324 cluster bacterium]
MTRKLIAVSAVGKNAQRQEKIESAPIVITQKTHKTNELEQAKPIVITEETFKRKRKQIPVSSLGFSLKKMNQVDEEFKIEWTSPDYKKVELLWGLFTHEKGERKTFLIRGKQGFCQTVLRDLEAKGHVHFV